jgi:hypothetical protein
LLPQMVRSPRELLVSVVSSSYGFLQIVRSLHEMQSSEYSFGVLISREWGIPTASLISQNWSIEGRPPGETLEQHATLLHMATSHVGGAELQTGTGHAQSPT